MKSLLILDDIYTRGITMLNHENNKNRILEVIIINGVRYVKDAINTRLISAQLAIRGSNVNVVSQKFLSVKTGSKLYF